MFKVWPLLPWVPPALLDCFTTHRDDEILGAFDVAGGLLDGLSRCVLGLLSLLQRLFHDHCCVPDIRGFFAGNRKN